MEDVEIWFNELLRLYRFPEAAIAQEWNLHHMYRAMLVNNLFMSAEHETEDL